MGLAQMLGTLQQAVRQRPHAEDEAAVRLTSEHILGFLITTLHSASANVHAGCSTATKLCGLLC